MKQWLIDTFTELRWKHEGNTAKGTYVRRYKFWNVISVPLAVILVMYLVVLLWVFTAEKECTTKWRESGFESRYLSAWAGCQIKIEGKWLPEHLIRKEF